LDKKGGATCWRRPNRLGTTLLQLLLGTNPCPKLLHRAALKTENLSRTGNF